MQTSLFRLRDFYLQGLRHFKEHFLFLLLYMVIMSCVSFLLDGLANIFYDQGKIKLFLLTYATEWVVGMYTIMGLFNSILLITSGIKPNFRQLYSNDSHFYSFVMGFFLYELMMIAGFILLIIPGCYVVARYGLFFFLILDKNMGPIESIKAASKISEGKRGFLFLMNASVCVLNIAGILFFGIGALITVPITFCALTETYRKIMSVEQRVVTV